MQLALSMGCGRACEQAREGGQAGGESCGWEGGTWNSVSRVSQNLEPGLLESAASGRVSAFL